MWAAGQGTVNKTFSCAGARSLLHDDMFSKYLEISTVLKDHDEEEHVAYVSYAFSLHCRGGIMSPWVMCQNSVFSFFNLTEYTVVLCIKLY